MKGATNALSDALEKLLDEAADRATWDQRQTRSRHAGWFPPDVKTYSGAEIPEEEQTMAGIAAEKGAR